MTARILKIEKWANMFDSIRPWKSVQMTVEHPVTKEKAYIDISIHGDELNKLRKVFYGQQGKGWRNVGH